MEKILDALLNMKVGVHNVLGDNVASGYVHSQASQLEDVMQKLAHLQLYNGGKIFEWHASIASA